MTTADNQQSAISSWLNVFI